MSAATSQTDFGFRRVDLDAKQDLVDDVFHKVAGRYDLMNDLMSAGLHRIWKDVMVTRLGVPKTRPFRHLDVAGGTGDVAFKVVGAGSAAEATVCDINAEMLKVGRARAETRGLSGRVEFVQGNAETLPFHATSSGLAVLAFQPDAFRDAFLSQPIPRLTGRTETNPETLRARLAEVRSLGLSESRGTFQAEVHSMAVPLFDALGRCMGAVAVAALALRMTEAQRRLIRFALTQAGTEITTLWGGTLPSDIATLWRLAA